MKRTEAWLSKWKTYAASMKGLDDARVLLACLREYEEALAIDRTLPDSLAPQSLEFLQAAHVIEAMKISKRQHVYIALGECKAAPECAYSDYLIECELLEGVGWPPWPQVRRRYALGLKLDSPNFRFLCKTYGSDPKGWNGKGVAVRVKRKGNLPPFVELF